MPPTTAPPVETEPAAYTRAERRRHLALAGALALVLLPMGLLVPTGAYSLSGEYVEGGSVRMAQAFAMSILVSFPIVAAVLALIVAALPYKGLSYLRRYPRAFLLTLIGVYGLLAAMAVLKLLRVALGV